jgi:hypothetical protein
MNYKTFFCFLFILISLFSCKNDPLDVSPTDKDLKINYINLDSIFVHTQLENLKDDIEKLNLYPNQILDYQLGHCLGIGKLSDSGTINRIKLFVNDEYVARLENEIAKKFSNLNKRKEKLNQGFIYLNHHFPNGKIPKNIVFINSFFASNVFCTEHEIGIGLERYLGPDVKEIQALPSQEFFQWIKDGMLDKFMERDVLVAWIMTHYVPEKKTNTAEAIVNWGKIIYLTEAAFPKENKEIILRYSKKDFDWAMENEYAFWKYLVDEKLLFTDNEKMQANFLNDAPFTIGLPEKGPDRLGQFLGWRIIHSYMMQFPETSLEELIKLPYNTILQEYEV